MMPSLCLAFVNTEALSSGRRIDRLTDADVLVTWLESTGAIDRQVAREARDRWSAPPIGAALLGEARSLRRTLRAAMNRIVDEAIVPRSAITAVNRLLARGQRSATLVSRGERFVLDSRFHASEPIDLLVPIAHDVADLLTTGDWRRIGRCAHPDCIRFFSDGSKSGTRRWCDMRTCGNRANVAAHYRRTQGHAY
jgi:predicted RNA-binding Zn ribbon-like protein